MRTLAIFLFGGLLGMRHAMEADHLAAVATLVTRVRSPRQAAMQGALWGLGHALALVAFAGLVVTIGAAIPESVATALELVVATMLIALGIDVVLRGRRMGWHAHVHTHVGDHGPKRSRRVMTHHVHAHRHSTTSSWRRDDADHEHSHDAPSTIRAVAIGVMHGLSGSAALVLLTLRHSVSRFESVAYIAVFGIGSVLGMGLLSFAVAIPMRASAGRWRERRRALDVVTGVGTLAVGLVMAWQLSRGLLGIGR